MPATNTLPQLVVARIGYDAPKGPRNSVTHPWRRTSRHDVVTVERAAGVARDAASRIPTPKEREATEFRNRLICEAWATTSLSAAQISLLHPGTTRSLVIGVVHRAGVKRGEPMVPRVVPAPRPASFVLRDRYIVRLLHASWSVAEVADLFDVTANTVLSVRYRARRDGHLPPASVRQRRAVTAPEPVTAVACEANVRVPFLDTSNDQCRNLDADGLCCGSPVVSGRSWCPQHLARYTLRRSVA